MHRNREDDGKAPCAAMEGGSVSATLRLSSSVGMGGLLGGQNVEEEKMEGSHVAEEGDEEEEDDPELREWFLQRTGLYTDEELAGEARREKEQDKRSRSEGGQSDDASGDNVDEESGYRKKSKSSGRGKGKKQSGRTGYALHCSQYAEEVAQMQVFCCALLTALIV